MAQVISLQYGGHTLQAERVQFLIRKGIEKRVPPSLFISQLYYESNWGASNVAKENNNWGGLTWTGEPNRPSGVVVSRGTPRPSNEQGYYMRFASVEDYFTDYIYLITDQGIYNIQGKNSFEESVRGLFKVGGAKYDYAAVGATQYVSTMKNIRAGINNNNNDFLTSIDSNPNEYVDGELVPDPPKDDSDGEDFEGIDIQGLFIQVKDLIRQMLSQDVFKAVNSQFFSNTYIQLMNQLENTYKVNAKDEFFNELENVFDEFNAGYIPPDPDPSPDPDPDPSPSTSWVFPVRLGNGINFFKRKNWGVGTIQREMTYGKRVRGFHAGYDIGGGGRHHPVYALADAVVREVRWMGTGGNAIVFDHLNDDYHSLYLHLKSGSTLVKAGDTVRAGERVATMGDTGANYPIHLHLELSLNGQFHTQANTVDPEPLLKVHRDNQTQLPLP